MKKSAEEYYNQLQAFDETGLTRDSMMGSTYYRAIGYIEHGTGRYIDITVYYDSPEENMVKIYPSYKYMENNILGDNNGSRIETFTNN
jgi:hypothetical protein